jgi:hypothetical protein
MIAFSLFKNPSCFTVNFFGSLMTKQSSKFRLCTLVYFLTFVPVAVFSQVNNWTGNNDNSWSNSANWSLGHVPATGETATFNNANLTGGANKTVNMNTTYAAGSPLGNIDIQSGYTGSLTINANITVSGNVSVGGTANLSVSNTMILSISGNLNLDGTATIGPNSSPGTINVTGQFNVLSTATGVTMQATILNVSGSTTISGVFNFSNISGAKNFNGEFTLASGGSYSATGNAAVTFAGNLTNNGGTFVSGSGTNTLSGAGKTISGSGTFTFSQDLTISGSYTNNGNVTIVRDLTGTGSLTQGATKSIYIGRNSSGITTFDASAIDNTVFYNGASGSSMKATTYYNLTANGSGSSGFSFTGNTTITNNLTISTVVTVQMSGNYTVTVSGATSVTNGQLSHGGFASAVYNLQDLTLNGGTLGATGSAGTINVGGTLTIAAGTTNTWAGAILNVTGATNVNGTWNIHSGSFSNGTKTFTGLVTVASTGSWNANQIATMIFQGGITNNGTFTSYSATFNTNNQALSGSNAVVFTNVVTVTGITVTNNGIVTLTLNNNSGGTAVLQGTGTWAQGVNSTLNWNSSTNSLISGFNASASGNTVNYNLANTQNIANPSGSTYYNLTLSGGVTYYLTYALTVTGNLQIGNSNATALAGAFGANVANPINVAGNWTVNSTAATPFLYGTQTVTMNGSSSSSQQTIGGTGTIQFYNLTVNNSGGSTGGVVLGTNIGNNIFSNLTVTNGILDLATYTCNRNAAGGTLSVASSGTLVVGGSSGGVGSSNYPSNFSTNTHNGTVNFNGAAAQTIPTYTYYNLTLSTNPVKTLAASTSVNNMITFTNAPMVNLAGYTLTLGTSAASPGTLVHTGTSANGWMYGGTFQRWLAVNAVTIPAITGLFPMGSSAAQTNDFCPLWIGSSSNLSSGGTVSVNFTYVAGNTNCYFTDNSWGRIVKAVTNSTWNVSSTITPSGSNLMLRYGGGAATFGVNNTDSVDACLLASAPATWDAVTSLRVNLEVNRIAISSANLNQTWRIGSADLDVATLPITWLKFEPVHESKHTVKVSWSTATETDNDHFSVLRSADGIVFEEVGKKYAPGSSLVQKDYVFADEVPSDGVWYYQVKQFDKNGAHSSTTIKSVNVSAEVMIRFYPNPAYDELRVDGIPLEWANSSLEIVDARGRIQKSTSLGTNSSVDLFVSDLAKGIYSIRIYDASTGQFHKTVSFIKS